MPVLSIGNVSVGGTGKTPMAAWLASRVARWGRRPAVVLRGYGRDEVLLHREINPSIPVLAAARRMAAIDEAIGTGADCIILDDAFQHRAIARDLDIVLVSAEQAGSNRRLLPRGPLREPMTSVRRADVLLVTRKVADRTAADGVLRELLRHAPPVTGIVHLRSGGLQALGGEGVDRPLATLDGSEVLAVTAIAEPGSFETTLARAGARVRSLKFPDHHEFTLADVRTIVGKSDGSPIVVSRKDAVKLRDLWPDGVEGWILNQSVEMEEGLEELDRAVRLALGESE